MSRLLLKIVPLSLGSHGELSVKAFSVRTILGKDFDCLRAIQADIDKQSLTVPQALGKLLERYPLEARRLAEIMCSKPAGWGAALTLIEYLAITTAALEANTPEKRPPSTQDAGLPVPPAPSGTPAPSLEDFVSRLVVERVLTLDEALELSPAQLIALYEAHVSADARRRASYAIDTAAAISSIAGGDALQSHIKALAAIADGTPS